MNTIYETPQKPELITVLPKMVVTIDPEFELLRYSHAKGLLDQYGSVFNSGPNSSDYPVFGGFGRCYDQAMLLASLFEELYYCEGFVLFGKGHSGIQYLMGHGWCALGNQVIDPSVSRAVQARRDLKYVGIPINLSYAEEWEREMGYTGMLDGHPSGVKVGPYVHPPTLWLDKLKERRRFHV